MYPRIGGLVLAVCSLFPSAALFAQSRYEAVAQRLHVLAALHPEAAEVFVLGKNDQGEDIKGLRIGTGDLAVKPAMLLVAAHHGDEGDSVDVAMRFAEDLLRPDSDERLHDSVFYVIPVLNLSGYNRDEREEEYRLGGTLDPNRDYADPCRKNAPHALASTRLLADFIAAKEIVTAVSVHGYIGTFTFPWGTYTDDATTADHGDYLRIAHQAVAYNGYKTGTHNDLIYPTIGAFEDWAYYMHGVWTALLEVQYNLDVAKDARAVGEFFALSPRQRSQQHEHAGQCRNVMEEDVLSRP